MSYSSEVLADSPLAYWKLDETSGTTAADSSGNGRDSTYVGAPTLGATSLLTSGVGHAMTLSEGQTNCASIASASWMNGLSAFTAEALVKITSSVDGANGDAILSRYSGAGFQWLLWRNTAGKFALQFVNSSVTVFNAAGTTTVVSGTIYHVVGTWDGSTAKIYVNGSLEGSVSTSGVLGASTAPIDIGRYSGSTAATPGGTFDEAAFYGTALSSTRIAAHSAAAFASGNATVTAVAATATASAAAPVVSASRTVDAPAATATASAIAPSVSGTGDATVAPPAASATAEALPPTLAWDSTVSAAVATATADALAPTVAVGATIAAPPAEATADAIAPFVDDGSGNQTVLAPVATATAEAVAPVVLQVLETSTDTTNLRNGRRRLAYATVTITRPVAAPPNTLTLATRVDKALAYPVPDMVDGRPT